MKIIGISRVRNEADIIEPFVRHNCAHLTKLIVVDDGSTDGTPEILRALQSANLPLVTLQEPAPPLGYEQQRVMTRLLHMAVDQFGADWVVPLDADEFVETSSSETLECLLSKQSPRVFSIFWTNFVWSRENAERADSNPVSRLRLRLPARTDMGKVIVPASLVDERSTLAQGNHVLLCEGRTVEAEPLANVTLCHFPIRDVNQYAVKIVTGYLKYRALSHRDDSGFHYVEPFDTLREGGLAALEARMESDSKIYSIARGTPLPPASPILDRSLRYLGQPVTCTKATRDPFPVLLQLSEEFAAAVGGRSTATDAVADYSLLRKEHSLASQRARQLAGDLNAMQVWTSQLEIELLSARQHEVARAAPPMTATIIPVNVIRTSPFFDAGFYRASSPALRMTDVELAEHYLSVGAAMALDPGPHFSTKKYLDQNPDVAAGGVNPLVHFELYGRAEGRLPPSATLIHVETIDPTTAADIETIRRSAYFDERFYRSACADPYIDPARHYLEVGCSERRDPGPAFSTAGYFMRYPDVAEAAVNALVHFERFGRTEGRVPIPSADARQYQSTVDGWMNAREARSKLAATEWSVDESDGAWLTTSSSTLYVPGTVLPEFVTLSLEVSFADTPAPKTLTLEIDGHRAVAVASTRHDRIDLACAVPRTATLFAGRLRVNLHIDAGQRLFIRRLRLTTHSG